jgi:hypothetical protein
VSDSAVRLDVDKARQHDKPGRIEATIRSGGRGDDAVGKAEVDPIA